MSVFVVVSGVEAPNSCSCGASGFPVLHKRNLGEILKSVLEPPQLDVKRCGLRQPEKQQVPPDTPWNLITGGVPSGVWTDYSRVCTNIPFPYKSKVPLLTFASFQFGGSCPGVCSSFAHKFRFSRYKLQRSKSWRPR